MSLHPIYIVTSDVPSGEAGSRPTATAEVQKEHHARIALLLGRFSTLASYLSTLGSPAPRDLEQPTVEPYNQLALNADVKRGLAEQGGAFGQGQGLHDCLHSSHLTDSSLEEHPYCRGPGWYLPGLQD